jgi:hypothetical protein
MDQASQPETVRIAAIQTVSGPDVDANLRHIEPAAS